MGVRLKPDAGYNTIFGALCFLVTSILIPILNINFVHCIWVIPIIYLLSFLSVYLFIYSIPIFKDIIVLLATIYAEILRFGVNKEEYRKRQEELNKQFIEEWWSKKKRDKLM